MAKSTIRVVTIFDGRKEAKDVFTELIADRIRRNDLRVRRRAAGGTESTSVIEDTEEIRYNQISS